MTLNQLDLLNVEELLELARDNALAVDGYNFSEIVLKIVHNQWCEGNRLGYSEGYSDAREDFDY